MTVLLAWCARQSLRHPVKTCVFWILLAGLCALAASLWLEIDANEDNLISEKLHYNRVYKDYLRTFGDLEYIYAVIGVPAAESAQDDTWRMRAATAADTLTTELEALRASGIVEDVVSRITLPRIDERFLLYEAPERLATHARSIVDSGRLVEAGDLVGLLRGYQQLFLGSVKAAAPLDELDIHQAQLEVAAARLQSLFAGMRACAQGKDPPEPPLLLPDIPKTMLWLESHLFTQQGSAPGTYDTTRPGLVLVQILPRKDFSSLSVIAEPLARIRSALDRVKDRFPDLDMGLTGRPVVHADEMMTTNRDVTTATCIAFPVVALLFFILFRSIRRPLLALGALAIGITCAYGFTAIALGRLNLLSVVFTLILIGLGIDFGIHIIARYLEELQRGLTPAQAAERSVLMAGRGCLAAAFTSSIACLTALFTDVAGLAELGLLAGVGIILCFAASITFLPASLVLLDRKRLQGQRVRQVIVLPLLDIGVRFWRPVVIAACLVSAAAVPFISRVGLDRNLLNLQARGLESVEYERRLIAESQMSTWEAVCMTSSAEEARTLAARLSAREDIVRAAETCESILPSPPNESESRKILAAALPDLERLTPAPIATGIDLPALRTTFAQLAFVSRATTLVGTMVPDEWRAVINELFAASQALQNPAVPEAALRERLLDYQERLLGAMRTQFVSWHSEWRKAFDPPTVTLEDVDRTLSRRFVTQRNGDFVHLVRIWPSGDAWQFPVMERFVTELRRELGGSHELTGVAVNFYESVKVMERAFLTAFVLAFVFVSILAFLDLWSLRFSLLALGTLLLGVLLTAGAMGASGLHINLANFFAFPVILGIGIDSAFHLLHRVREPGQPSRPLSPFTAMAVILSSLTSLVGLGSLMTASHRGLASMGRLLALGTASCLIVSLVVLPAILCLIDKTMRPQK